MNNYKTIASKPLIHLSKSSIKYFVYVLLNVAIKIIIQGIIAFAIAKASKNIIDLEEQGILKELFLCLGIILVLNMTDGFINYFLDKSVITISGTLYNRVLSNILGASVREVEEMNSGEIVTLISNEIRNIESAYKQAVPNIVYTMLLAFSILIYLLFLEETIASILFFFSLIIWIVNRYLMKKLKRLQVNERIVLGAYNDSMISFLKDMATIRTYNCENEFVSYLSGKTKKLRYYSNKYGLHISLLAGINNFLFCMCLVITIIAGIYFWSDHANLVIVIVPVVYLEMKIIYLFRKFDEHLAVARKGQNSYEKLMDFTSKDYKSENVIRNTDSHMCIELNDVGFTYGANKEVLNNISLRFEKGNRVAFIGKNGCGKSTLLKIISGLYYPTKGNVRYFTENIMSDIAYVHQEYYVNNLQLIELLMLSAPNLTEEIIKEKAMQYGFHEVFCNMKKEYRTMLGEGGKNISGGERQLISIFMALLKQPQILILDECISALEVQKKGMILNCINNLPKEMTIIISDHDKSIINCAERVYIMNRGNITEEGTNDYLRQNSAEYREILNFN